MSPPRVRRARSFSSARYQTSTGTPYRKRGKKLTSLTPLQRFKKNILKDDSGSGCWNWNGSLTEGGYGYFWYEGRTGKAHRFSWEHYRGRKVPDGRCVLHRCHNPRCVNPKHLYLGTFLQNSIDRDKAERTGNTKLTVEQVLEARIMHSDGCAHCGRKFSIAEIAEKYGVSYWTISMVVYRKSWKYV